MTLENAIWEIKEEEGVIYEKATKWLYKFFERKKYEKPGSDFLYSLKIEGIEEAYNDAIKDLIYSIKVGTYKGEAEVKTFFYRIFKNKLIDTYKKEKKKGFVYLDTTIEHIIKKVEREEEIEHLLEEIVTPEQNLIEQEELLVSHLRLKAIQDFLKSTETNCREKNKVCCSDVLKLWSEDYKYQEIADKLSMPVGSVSTKISGCLEKIKNHFHLKQLE